MKKRLVWVLAAGFIFFGCVGNGFAETADKSPAHGKLGVGLRVGYNQYANGTLNKYEVDMDPAGCYGVNASYFFYGDFCVEGGVEYAVTKFNLKERGDRLATEIGDLSQLAFLCTVRYQPVVFGSFMPYLGAGGAYYVNSFDHVNPTVELNLKDKFGWHVSGGVEYHAEGPVWLGLDMRYTWNDTYDEDPSVPEPKTITMDAFQVFGGVKLYF